MKKQNKARVFKLTRSLKSLARSVGWRNRASIARQAMKDDKIQKKVVELMGKLLSKELSHVTSLKAKSLLCKRSAEVLEAFFLGYTQSGTRKEGTNYILFAKAVCPCQDAYAQR